jgi:HK97 family phage major capsid protein
LGTDLEKVAALTYLTDELLADAPALGAWCLREGGNELRFQVEDKVINGTGAGVPLGLLNATATVSQSKETGQAAATVVTENVTKMWARMPAYLMGGAKWYINQELLPQLVTLSIAVGLAGQVVPASIYQQPTPGTPFGTLFGRPVQPVEFCAALGTVGDIILANMGEYYLIDNGGIQSATSIHVNFTTDETALRLIYRVNGFPFWASAMTPYKGTNTLSPYITLLTRA